MPIFPLYDQLYQSTKPNHLSKFQNQDFIVDEINKLEPAQHELIYVLIRVHQITFGDKRIYTLPNGCKKLKKGLKVDVEQLPDELLYILEEFIKIHLKNCKK